MHFQQAAPKPRSRFHVWLPLAAIVVAGSCTDDDDPQFPAGETEFASFLSEDAEVPTPQNGTRVRVTLINRGPAAGTFQTPVWVAFHDGTFELFDTGSDANLFFPMSGALERLAEDGDTTELEAAFEESSAGVRSGVLTGQITPGPLEPGESMSMEFELDPLASTSRYFSYASMVVPSNDAFVANDDPLAHEIFDAGGNFVASNILVLGSQVLDAGTEDNDEVPANTAFFGQTGDDVGVDENGVVALHPGFLAADGGDPAITILEDPTYADADFTATDYLMLEIRFEEVVTAAPKAFGNAVVQVDSVGGQLLVEAEFSGLSGPVVGAHFHEAAVGATGPVVVSLTSSVENLGNGQARISGNFPVSGDVVGALRDGDLYLNVHTDLNPDGEIRGQLEPGAAYVADLDSAQEVPTPIAGDRVMLIATNRAPMLGTYQTPVWLGIHDGTFDAYDTGSAASAELESLAEDGDGTALDAAFTTAVTGGRSLLLPGAFEDGPLQPGESSTRIVTLDGSASASRYLSHATMVLPSNDAFLANDDPMALELFDVGGALVESDTLVLGSEVLDAGTEVNDELPANTAFFGQVAANSGTSEGGLIAAHPGFLAPDGGDPAVTILEDPQFTSADFTDVGYVALRLRVVGLADDAPKLGRLTLRLSQAEDEIEVNVSAENLSGEVVGMHLHEGAVGATGPVLVDLTDLLIVNEDGRITAKGTKSVNAAFVTALEAGEIYVNVHTALNPDGEIRGQVVLAD